MTEDDLFQFLCRIYTQEADARQRSLGLQYTTAETHDLARQIHLFINYRMKLEARDAARERDLYE